MQTPAVRSIGNADGQRIVAGWIRRFMDLQTALRDLQRIDWRIPHFPMRLKIESFGAKPLKHELDLEMRRADGIRRLHIVKIHVAEQALWPHDLIFGNREGDPYEGFDTNVAIVESSGVRIHGHRARIWRHSYRS